MNIISIASPVKRAALEKVGITTPKKRKVESYCFNKIKIKLFRLKSSNKESEKALRRSLVTACIQSKDTSAMNVSRHLGIKWSYLKICSELNEDGYRYKVRSDKIFDKIVMYLFEIQHLENACFMFSFRSHGIKDFVSFCHHLASIIVF